ncbi:MAG: ABC transporter permease [bacterium]|nr:ABC transporter permease [bacterium]
MRKVFWLARREYLAAVKTKGFVIGLALAPIVMCGSILAMIILENRVDTTDKHIAVIDHSGVVVEGLVEAAEKRNSEVCYEEGSDRKVKPEYIFEPVEADLENPRAQRLELSDRVRESELAGFLEIGPDALHPGEDEDAAQISYYSRTSAFDDITDWMGWPLNLELRRSRLAEVGVDPEIATQALAWTNVQPMELMTVDEASGEIEEAREANRAKAILLPLGMMMLMFILVLMGATPLLNSIMEEKTQRIAEVLLGSIRPSEFMAGKILGGVAVSLTASSVYMLGGIVAVTYMGMSEHIPFHILPWFFVLMVCAIVMYGSVYAALGAVCTDPKDAQNLMFPAMLPTMIPMFVIVPVAKEPLAGWATGMSLFPPFTPPLMLLRLATPADIPAWQPWVGLLGVILFAALFVWIGGRIFRVGILMQGKSPTLANIVRWAIKG